MHRLTPAAARSQALPQGQAEAQFGAFFRKGYQSYQRERYAEALDQFQQAVRIAPTWPKGITIWGRRTRS